MRNRLTWAVLLTACFSGGCTSLCHPLPAAIPVRRLPDEVLQSCSTCPPAVGASEIIGAKGEKPGSVRQAAEFGLPSTCEVPACGGCAVFYTGGALGSGEYPLKPGLRVTEAIAVARGPIQAGMGRPSPSRVTVLRRLSCGRQLAIRVDLNEALRDPRENIPLWPGDMLVTSETCCETVGRVFHQFFHIGLRLPAQTLVGYPMP